MSRPVDGRGRSGSGTRAPARTSAERDSPHRPLPRAWWRVLTATRRPIVDDVVRLERSDGTTSELTGHEFEIASVNFSPDGSRVVTAGGDHHAILWDAATGSQLRSLRGHFGSLRDARFSPDGRWILTSGPRSVGIWRASDGQLTRLWWVPRARSRRCVPAGLAHDRREDREGTRRRIRVPDLWRCSRAPRARDRAAAGNGSAADASRARALPPQPSLSALSAS